MRGIRCVTSVENAGSTSSCADMRRWRLDDASPSEITTGVEDDNGLPTQDIARDKLFVFGREGDGKRFAFECDGSLKPKPTEYKSTAKPTDGFREAQDCIAVFAKDLKKR